MDICRLWPLMWVSGQLARISFCEGHNFSPGPHIVAVSWNIWLERNDNVLNTRSHSMLPVCYCTDKVVIMWKGIEQPDLNTSGTSKTPYRRLDLQSHVDPEGDRTEEQDQITWLTVPASATSTECDMGLELARSFHIIMCNLCAIFYLLSLSSFFVISASCILFIL